MEDIMHTLNNNEAKPWYTQNKKSARMKKELGLPHSFASANHAPLNNKKFSFKRKFFLLGPIITSFVSTTIAGILLGSIFVSSIHGAKFIVFLSLSIILLLIAFYFVFCQIGLVCSYISPKLKDSNSFSLGLKYSWGELKIEEEKKGIPAPEMALSQFVQQVKAYAVEKSFLKQRNEKEIKDPFSKIINNSEHSSLIKRRWNDVVDSLNEFEIYLANDPKGIIEKLISKSPSQDMDVSQIFRDVAETFDTSWRRKGINIEQAIVTPLKAHTNEAVLRRLLVGPWRSCVYFARRGNGVVFSANSTESGKILARWECDGVVFPEAFFELVQNNTLSVNERIENGMMLISQDPVSHNTMFALISFVTWIDLANAANSNYEIHQGNEGLIIELKL